MKKILLVTLLFSFISLSMFGGITITSPNGGEVWAGCTNKTITWNSSGVSNYYKIDYSTDNGVTWVSMATNLFITTNQYSWTIPNISSTSCLVRVMDQNEPDVFDISDITFSITAPLIVTMPNGGETWEGGTTQIITWAHTGTTNYFDIHYSIDAGSTWILIESNYYSLTGQYNWSLPNNPSSTCLIRVRDKTNTTCMVDMSDNLFTISPATPTITVTSPNTNLTRYVGNTYNITWTSQYVTSNAVKIDYSINNGSSWVPIVSNTTNSGTYSWLVPNTPSTQCLVRITDLGNPTTYDESNTTFTIATPWINVTGPNGGETIGGCTSRTINWTHAGTSGSFRVQYSINNGETWTTLISSTSSSSYNWNPVPSISSNQCLVKVFDINNNDYQDVSNGTFTIVPNSDIIITSPNGGEEWEAGTNQSITWVSAPTSTRYSVHYSINNGGTWSTVTNSTYSNSFSWNVPNEPSNECLIRVRDYDNSCILDLSDEKFTITPPTPIITVTTPNTSTTRYIGNSFNITWTSAYLTSNFVNIEYTYDNGITWHTIASVTENDGTHLWTVPETPSNQCRVRISEYNNPSVFDESNANFTIAYPWINVTAPNGGQVWKGCSSQTITWSHAGTSGTFRIWYSLNDGATWSSITTTSSSSYNWSQVVDSPSDQVLIKVSDNSNPTYFDESNNTFTITKNLDIVITAPNGGENWEVGTNQSITWVSEPSSSRYIVHYSPDNGSSWNSVTNSTYSTNHTWTVPNDPSNQALIRVRDYNNTCIQDVSDAVFTIAPPTPIITVTNPNTSTTRYIGNTANITWTSAYLTSSFVTIEYTYDDGNTWNMIAPIVNNNGTYSWMTPETPSNLCRVRISEYNNPSVFDESNTNFTIAYPWIYVNSPNGGQVWKGCSSQTISWSHAGTSGSFRLWYSLNNGTSWSSIATTTASSYNWAQVVDSPSDQVLIKVSDNNNPAYFDESNNTLTILKNVDIVITAPNGGENWEVGTNQNITWVSEPSSSRYIVHYSADNGNSWNSITNSTYSTSQTWSVPNDPSNQALIRVRDYNNTCIQDISDDVFTINPPTPIITVTNPNTSGNRYIGNTANITWTSAYLTSSFVTIEYTYDDGNTWNMIAPIVNNTGTYSWLTPETPSNQCRVRISEYNNPSVFDESNTNFTIAYPWIAVTSPNGGQVWNGCSSQTITWSHAGTSGSFRLWYSLNNGTSWSSIATTTASSYNWNPVYNNPSEEVLIKVTDNNNPAYFDISNNVFVISENNDIIITSPNGGEQWQAGSSQTISWVAAPGSTRFSVLFSINNGSTWNTITSSTYSTSQVWTIPNTPASNCLIRVRDFNNTCIEDYSDDAFSITPGTPKLLVPNGGQTWYYASNYNITWTNEYFNGNFVSLSYSVDNGLSWLPITSATNNTGSYSWNVPANYSSTCLVKVSEYNNPSVFDISDAVFTIAPALTIITPNGNNMFEEWRVCTQTSIQWFSGGTSNSFKIEYSTNGGSSWNSITNNFISSGNNHSYEWSMPNTPSQNCLVRVTDNANSLKTDVSDAVFTIKPCLIIASPNGAESFAQGSTQTITWTSDGASNYYNIDYSINGGSTWTNIAFNQYITSNSFDWTVPAIVSSNCLVRIIDHINTCKRDVSDNTFSIGMPAPQITVISPNGGESLAGCETYNIEWMSENTSNNYTLEYSTNNGNTWNIIVSNHNSISGIYSWDVPNIVSENCLIRIKDFSNQSISGISNNVFSINQSVSANITSSGPTNFCLGGSVELTSSSAIGNVWFPGGQTTQSITVSSSGSYYVVVSNGDCSAVSENIIVQVNAIPNAPVATSNSPVGQFGTIELYASTIPGAAYIWTGPNGFTAFTQNPVIPNATPSMNGIYSVSASVNACNGPEGSTTVTVNEEAQPVVISGSIQTEIGQLVPGVEVNLTGAGNDNFLTDATGLYVFGLIQGESYIVTPTKNNDILVSNGISTLDLILMQRHILNIDPFDSPYKIIAADVDGSNTVTNMDIVLTRALILQNISHFPDNNIWKFINSDFIFSDPMNPFPYESSRSYSSAANAIEQNFIGVKLGDVNNSWNPTIAKSLKNSNLIFEIPELSAVSGDVISVPIRAYEFSSLSGLQFTLEWDKTVLSYAGTINQQLEMSFGQTQINNGMLSGLWSTENPDGYNIDNGAVMFEVLFEVIGSTGFYSEIQFSSQMTSLEAYNTVPEEIAISVIDGIVNIENPSNYINYNNAEFYANVHPNPFSDYINILFTIPDNEFLTIEIFDIYGKKVEDLSNYFTIGNHIIKWYASGINGSELSDGTYLLSIKSQNYNKVMKLILMK